MWEINTFNCSEFFGIIFAGILVSSFVFVFFYHLLEFLKVIGGDE